MQTGFTYFLANFPVLEKRTLQYLQVFFDVTPVPVLLNGFGQSVHS